jgi:fermentation-respiration switch protein FrsA (DUF1100 family)
MSMNLPKRRRSRRLRPQAGDAALRPALQPVRQLVHGRQVVCRAYRRDDGCWDIEGRLADVKTGDVQLGGIHVAAGEPYRALALAVTVDNAHTIQDARVEVDVRTAGSAACARAAVACEALQGRRIDTLFAAETAERFVRAADCPHLAELFGAVIATARETIPLPLPTVVRVDADD